MSKIQLAIALLLLPLLAAGIVFADDEKASKPQDKMTKGKGTIGKSVDAKILGLELQDSEGKTHKLSDYKDKVVVLEWTNPQCPYVVRHYDKGTFKKLATDYASKGVVWLSVNSSHFASAGEMQDWRKKHDLAYPALLDASGVVGHAFGAKTTPHMFIMKNGKMLYDGAIDDGRKGEATQNYVATALNEILAGKTVSKAKTKPYGCGVKYAPAAGS